MSGTIFGYGSLIVSPERPDLVVGRRFATLDGYRRRFNKKSCNRYCPRELSFRGFDDDALPVGFVERDRYVSLVLGTEVSSGSPVVGVCLDYPPESWDEVRRLTDAREGYDGARDSTLNGYLRTLCEVSDLEGGGRRVVTVYLSNADPKQIFYVPPALPLETRAMLLVNATPRDPCFADRGLKASGLYYLESVRRDLRSAGIVDPELERVAAAVLALDGPWCALVEAPR